MSKKPDFGTVGLPEICKACGDALLDQAKREAGGNLNRITRYCPHKMTLIHAELGELEGIQGITRWGLLGPVSADEAIEQIKELADSEGVDIEILRDSERLH